MSLLRIMMEQTAEETVPDQPSKREAEAADKGKEEKIRAGWRKDDSRRESALFTATNLVFWETDKPHHNARDVSIDGTCFRRLDPEYNAWLRHKMTLTRNAADSGRFSAGASEELRARFNAIHAWTIEHFGENALRSAIRALDPKPIRHPRRNLREPAVRGISRSLPQAHLRRKVSGTSTRRTATGRLPIRFRLRPWPRWTPYARKPRPRNGPRPASARTAAVSACPAVKTTGWSVAWTETNASARSPGSSSRSSVRRRGRPSSASTTRT